MLFVECAETAAQKVHQRCYVEISTVVGWRNPNLQYHFAPLEPLKSIFSWETYLSGVLADYQDMSWLSLKSKRSRPLRKYFYILNYFVYSEA